MDFTKTSIPEIVLIKPKVREDHRGYFVETFREDEFNKAIGYRVNFFQENETQSKKGVLRGLHFQLPPFAQSKLVRVIEGEVLDISVDIREGSPTFGQHIAENLNDRNKHQLFIPRGFAHGFVVLSERAIFSYKVDNYFSSKSESGIAFDDPSLGINWKLPLDKLNLSDKDLRQPRLDMLSDESSQFNYKKNLYD
tara:strand:+ start:65271 stop:65855 length:585 start_codon:yes stop_codon:yes gene_type:complete